MGIIDEILFSLNPGQSFSFHLDISRLPQRSLLIVLLIGFKEKESFLNLAKMICFFKLSIIYSYELYFAKNFSMILTKDVTLTK